MLRKALFSLLVSSIVANGAAASDPDEDTVAIRCAATQEIANVLRQEGFVPEFAGVVRLSFPGVFGSGLMAIYRNDSTKDVIVLLFPDSQPNLACLIGAGKMFSFKQNA